VARQRHVVTMLAALAAQSRRPPKTRADSTRIHTHLVDWLAGQLGPKGFPGVFG
jgi:hypothetical protein